MYNFLSKDKNFNQLLKGSSFNVVAKFLGVAFGFIASFLIARKYGSALIGEIATITSTFTLLSLIALLGNQTLVLKLVPEHIEKYGHATARNVYQKLLVITTWSTITVILTWLLLEKLSGFTLLKGLENYTILVATLVTLAVFRELNTKTLRGLGDYKIYSLLELLPAILLAITAIISVALNIPEHHFQYAYFIPLLIIGLLSFIFVIKTFELNVQKNKIERNIHVTHPTKTKLIKTSLPMLGITLSTAIISHFDILMLNYYTSTSSVGVYSIYVKIVAATALATNSINAMFAPTVSKLYSSEDTHQLKFFCKKTTLLSFIATLIASILVFLLYKPFLGLFGPEFLAGETTLFLLIISTLAGSFFGSVGLYLNMTGHQIYFFRVMIFAAVLNVVLNSLLIPIWGPLGAAVATLFSVVTWNVLATMKILKEHNYTLIWGGKNNA